MIQLFVSSIVFGTVILYGALGEILTEKSGNLNLGVPGIMYLGGIAGLASAFAYETMVANPIPIVCILISFIAAFLAAALGGLIYSFLTITLRANQNVTGLTLTIFGGGVANFFGGALNTLAGGVGQISIAATSAAYRTSVANSVEGQMGWFGQIFLSHGFMVYLAVILAIVMHFFIKRTKAGLNLRAVGENPATADAAGINVTRYRYLATCIGAGISGLGGLYYTVDYIKGTWASEGTIEALGWLAVALVIFAIWRSLNVIWGSYLFGFLTWLYQYVPELRAMLIGAFKLEEDALGFMNLTRSSMELFKMLPYVATILVLIVVSTRKKRENQPPNALGIPYFREER